MLGLRHINDLHLCFMSMQYPLIFPYGEDGFRTNIKHRNVKNSEPRRMSTIRQHEYYSFRLQYRPVDGHNYFLMGDYSCSLWLTLGVLLNVVDCSRYVHTGL